MSRWDEPAGSPAAESAAADSAAADSATGDRAVAESATGDHAVAESATGDHAVAESATGDRALADPRLPSSFLEVRVRADRLEVVEFYSHGAADGLSRTLRGLGLDLRVEFDSPCG